MKRIVLGLAAFASTVALITPVQAAAVPGLTATVYNNIPYYQFSPTDMTIDQEEAYTATVQPDSTAIFLADPQAFSYNPTAGQQATNFSGSLNIVNAGAYTFNLAADDAARLRVDGQIIAEQTFYNGGVSAPSSVTLNLAAGAHAYDLFYFQTVGGSYLNSGFTDPELGATFTSELPPVAAAVPEPASWAMSILGFVVLGFGMRRRSARTARIVYR